MTGVGVLVVGLLLCFAGRLSIHLAVLLSGSALGWLLADSLGASAGVAAVVAGCSAVVAWVLATFVFRAAATKFVTSVSDRVLAPASSRISSSSMAPRSS